MLSEYASPKATDTVRPHSREVPRGLRSTDTGRRWWELGLGGGRWGLVCNGGRVSVWEGEKVLEMGDGGGCARV